MWSSFQSLRSGVRSFRTRPYLYASVPPIDGVQNRQTSLELALDHARRALCAAALFDELPPDGPLQAPVLYLLVCLTINTTLRLLLNLVIFIPPIAFVTSANSPEVRPILIGLLALFVGLLVLFPLFSLVYFFMFTLIQHGRLRLLAGRNQRVFRQPCGSSDTPRGLARPCPGYLS
jgi:hypothetical protein